MYGQDTIADVYNEIRPIQNELEQCGREMKKLAQDAATADSAYELAKNKTLIELFKEESADKTLKRTEAQRQSIYREKHHDLRLKARLAANELKAQGDYLRSLQSRLTAVQTKGGILRAEMNLTQYTA